MTKRRSHRLRANKTTQTPTHLVFYDTETEAEWIDSEVERHRLRLGWAVYVRRPTETSPGKEEWHRFNRPLELWKWVDSWTREKTRLYVIAHNQQFDFLVTDGFRSLGQLGYRMTRGIIDTDITILSFRSGRKTIRVYDSTNWFKESLARLGESVGIPKLKVDFSTVEDEELSTYCKRDVEILKEVVLRWIDYVEAQDLGTFSWTAAGQAFTAYRHRFMTEPIFIHNHDAAFKLERKAYHGGRCECLYIGHVRCPVWCLDFNSLYPYVMRTYPYPTRLSAHFSSLTIPELRTLLKERCVVADVLVSIDKPALPVIREKLIFPTGRFRTTLSTPELKWVLQNGRIHKVYEAASYRQAPIFKDYVDYFYQQRLGLRAKGDKVGDKMAKLMLNSLYGKFGQKSRVIEVMGDCDPMLFAVEPWIDADTGEKMTVQYIGGQIRAMKRTEEEAYHSFPAIAAHVTAYARMVLYSTMEKAGERNVYYVDTDSLFVNQDGYDRLHEMIDPGKLGMLKVEGQADYMMIYGAKDYVFGSRKKIKGVRPDAVEVEPGVYLQEKFCRALSMIRKIVPDAVDVEHIRKRLSREYDKGVIGEDGWTRPFALCEAP